MTGLVTVDLTEKHITAGERAVDRRLSRECNCPVAHALADAGFDKTLGAVDQTWEVHRVPGAGRPGRQLRESPMLTVRDRSLPAE